MKKNMILAVAVSVAVAFWVAFSQVRMEKKLARLQAENQRLAEGLSSRNAFIPEGTGDAKARLEQTELALALAEQRLRNLTMQLDGLQNRLQPYSRPSRSILPRSNPTSSAEPRPPASSHSATGELLDRSWGPEQAVGPPNTPEAGDIQTAWASREPDGGEEWLKLEYERDVDLAEVRVRETYNPGAIAKITAFLGNGQGVTIWEGQEPPGQAPVDTSFPVNASIRADSIKVYLDTRRVPGWNEIDAVELVGRDGTRQWARAATASSTFAER